MVILNFDKDIIKCNKEMSIPHFYHVSLHIKLADNK